MSSTARKKYMSAEDYLVWEAEQPTKNEYVAGEVFAMVGVTLNHGQIAGNLSMHLGVQVRSHGCRFFVSDVKVQVEAADAFLYPDFVVSCEPGPGTSHIAASPRLIAEILSPSTASFDRGRKLEMYRSIPTLEDYLLIDAERVSVHRLHRTAVGPWVLEVYGRGDRFELPSVGATLAVDALYDGVELPPPAPQGTRDPEDD
ncbi:MAG: hypothetical protein AMXMBFR64_35960 [Myxococcales bacterium]